MTRLHVFGAIALGVAVTLGGCAPADTPSATTLPIDTASPTSTPTPTPVPTKPPVSELILTTEGLDYLKFGQPVPQVDEALAIVSYDANGCGDGTGAWLNTYDDPNHQEFVVRMDGVGQTGNLEWVVVGPHIGTDRHVFAGDSRASVLGAYPEAEQYPLDRDDIDLYIVRGTAGMLLFEFPDPSAGYPDVLFTLRGLAIDYPSIYAIEGTGAGGPCEF